MAFVSKLAHLIPQAPPLCSMNKTITRMHILRPQGILNSSSGCELLDEVKILFQLKACDVMVDCSELTFMDSSGLGCLIQILKLAREYNSSVSLSSVNYQLQTVLELTSATKLFKVVD